MDHPNFPLSNLGFHSISSVSVNFVPSFSKLPLSGMLTFNSFSDAAKALGFVQIDDPNTPDAKTDGLTTVFSTVNEQRQRVSTFDAFLPREIALKREKHLTICTNTILSRIGFSQEDGIPRTDRVFFKLANPNSDKIYSAKVNKEVIVCSGSLGSPQVLMLRFASIPCLSNTHK